MLLTAVRRASSVALVGLVAGLAGCGGGTDGGETTTYGAPAATETESPAAGQEVRVTAVEYEDRLGWDPADLTADAGTVEITMENPERNQLPHTVAIEGNGVDESGEAVEGGQTTTVSAELDAGEYTFYCPVGEHRENGMEGTLTVE